MESGSELGTYIAYGFVVLFLLVVALAAARSYSMILSLILLAFMPKKKEDYERENADASVDGNDQRP
ncbi:MAG: hypothetical protein H7Z40_23890 [Phycisphaerae bacterium]|nr:hypothetical protein [Gemmatimonadaceae bacterium]